MIHRPFSILATAVFTLVAFAHLHRLVFQWEVVANGTQIPLWTSVLGVLVAGVLAVGVWRESRKDRR